MFVFYDKMTRSVDAGTVVDVTYLDFNKFLPLLSMILK